MDFHQNLDHLEVGSEEGPRVEEGPNAGEVALVAPSAYCAFSSAEIEACIHHRLQYKTLVADRN